MNLNEYQKLKRQREKDLEGKPQRKLCLSCYRTKNSCLCKLVKPFNTKIRYILLIHPMEAKKERNGTGRLTHMALKNSEILMGINFDDERPLRRILDNPQNDCYILYPGKQSLDLSDTYHSTRMNKKVEALKGKEQIIIFLIDATWSCAKKMMRESTCLHNLPKVSFSPRKKSLFIIKQQPDPLCLSTIEAAYEVINCLHKEQKRPHENLLDILEGLVQFQITCMNDPNKKGYRRSSFKNPEKRNVTKFKRKLFF